MVIFRNVWLHPIILIHLRPVDDWTAVELVVGPDAGERTVVEALFKLFETGVLPHELKLHVA